MKKFRLLSLVVAIVMIASTLTSCWLFPQPPVDDEEKVFDLEYAEGTTLRMATGYNSTKTGLFFDAETAGNGITLPDGNTYNTGGNTINVYGAPGQDVTELAHEVADIINGEVQMRGAVWA